MSATVLDTSAVLAWLRAEPGAEVVRPLLAEGVLSAINAAELTQKLTQHGVDAPRTLSRLRILGLHVAPFGQSDALATGALWPSTRAAGLSLGDRACLATAQRQRLPVLTADQAWKDLDLDVEVQLIR